MSISSSHKSPNLKVALAVVASTACSLLLRLKPRVLKAANRPLPKRQTSKSANQYSTCQDGNI
jgi:hypothetical protein